jgi:hypothetical protein
MELHLQARTSLPKAKGRSAGRCSPCERPAQDNRPTVHLYGQAFHHDCGLLQAASKGRPPRGARKVVLTLEVSCALLQMP